MWPSGFDLREAQLLFPTSNDLAIIGAFEFDEDERDAGESLVALMRSAVESRRGAALLDAPSFTRTANHFFWE
jgi:hypothetical protein